MKMLQEKLNRGEKVLIDGATGTELEVRNVPMVKDGWNAAATLTHPEVVQQVHEDYIKLGAELIITNTFSTARAVLEHIGMGADFEALNVNAVKLARAARAAQNAPDVAIAAGMALATSLIDAHMTADDIARDHGEQARLLAGAGADLIILEMMSHVTYTPLLIEAAAATGLPVWLGISTRVSESGEAIMRTGGEDVPVGDFLAAMPLDLVGAVLVMHTLTEHIDAALTAIPAHWSGPIGVYAHSGTFISPNWQFIDMITPEDYAANAQRWLDQGVQIIGGCCGIGVKHIEVLAQVIDS